ncbi:MAG: hypothetical protein WC498_03490 [Candidatus Saccharimonadales bacterium]
MAIVQVLKRKDAASVIVAVVVAMVLSQFVTQFVGGLAGKLSGQKDGQFVSFAPFTGWRGQYLYPFVLLVLELILLEVVIRVYTAVHAAVTSKR